MTNEVIEEVLAFIDENPPSIFHPDCELCGARWLVTISNKDRYGLPARFTMCRQCGLVTQNPRWDDSVFGEFYSHHYRSLVRHFARKDIPPDRKAKGIRSFEQAADATGLSRDLPANPRVLDIGGGRGWLAEHLRDNYDAEVTIVEPNRVEAEMMEAQGFEVFADVFEKTEFPPESFDLVVMFRTVDHLIEAAETFTGIRRILKPGGMFLVDGVDYFSRMANVGDATIPLKIDHCYYYSPETLVLMLRKCGLHPVATDIAIWNGKVVCLAQADEPVAVVAEGTQVFPGAELRFAEWERYANRPNPESEPGYLSRSIQKELKWLGRRVRGKRS